MTSTDYLAQAIRKTNDALRSLIDVLPGVYDHPERLIDESDVLVAKSTEQTSARIPNEFDERTRKGS